MDTLGQARRAAGTWLNRPAVQAGPVSVVDSGDRTDWIVWDRISRECTALGKLDTELSQRHGVNGLVSDLWMAAYSQDPMLAEPQHTPVERRSNRAVATAMLDTPEHNELREITVGDPYMAAMSVLAQAPTLHTMLDELDPFRAQKTAQDTRTAADAAADQVEQAMQDAQDAATEAAGLPSPGDNDGQDEVDGNAQPDTAEQQPEPAEQGDTDPSGQDGPAEPDEQPDDGDGLDELEVPRPQMVDLQRAITDAEGSESEAQKAEQAAAALGQDDPDGEQAARTIRAVARQACAEAAEKLEAEATTMEAWGVDEGQRERMNAQERMRLASKLGGRKLKDWAEIIGRFRQLAQAQRARRVENARSEYVGVTLGDDLTSLLPTELVNLALPTLRAEFAVRYAEKRLMTYEQRGDEHEGQGAIIACVDCSESMSWPNQPKWPSTERSSITREAYAKALTLALLDQARASTPVREFAAILFAAKAEKPIVFPADQPVDLKARLKLASDFPSGGTNFMAPLDEALDLLQFEYNTTGRQRADIVFITDGQCRVDNNWLTSFLESKSVLGFRVFGLTVGEDAGARTLERFCDDVRHIDDLTDSHAVADLFRAI
ncbi:VWA domain-containing protein [Pseudonocardiaceae bacterium YIM PH 21723]|nr:VWA domain-containing protein [Pseudonocardiaceae bacterium YIM PH 21723]